MITLEGDTTWSDLDNFVRTDGVQVLIVGHITGVRPEKKRIRVHTDPNYDPYVIRSFMSPVDEPFESIRGNVGHRICVTAMDHKGVKNDLKDVWETHLFGCILENVWKGSPPKTDGNVGNEQNDSIVQQKGVRCE